ALQFAETFDYNKNKPVKNFQSVNLRHLLPKFLNRLRQRVPALRNLEAHALLNAVGSNPMSVKSQQRDVCLGHQNPSSAGLTQSMAGLSAIGIGTRAFLEASWACVAPICSRALHARKGSRRPRNSSSDVQFSHTVWAKPSL